MSFAFPGHHLRSPVCHESEFTVKICFVAHFARRAITGHSDGHIGGVERQTNLMARWLVRRGHEVSVIVWGQNDAPQEQTIDGVRVISLCRESDGVPGLRFFVPRWSSLIRALRRANADIYYQNCAEYVTGQVALWTGLAGRRFVYSVASDTDCDPELPALSSLRERWLYRYGLRNADAVIAQTSAQQQMLHVGFARKSTVLPMPCETLPRPVNVESQDTADGVVSWIGRLDPVKRPEAVVDISAEVPDLQFHVIGPPGGSVQYQTQIKEHFETSANALLMGPVDFSAVRSIYERSALLLSTSKFEGFPNTFLEAWSCGCPVVSTVDPDGVISRHGLGLSSPEISQLPDLVRKVAKDRQEYAERCREFFEKYHEKNVAMDRFESLLIHLDRGLS